MSNTRPSRYFSLIEQEKNVKAKLAQMERYLKIFNEEKQREEFEMRQELFRIKNKLEQKEEEIMQGRINLLQCDIDDVFPVSSEIENKLQKEIEIELLLTELELIREESESMDTEYDLRFRQLAIEKKEREDAIKKLKGNIILLNSRMLNESGNNFFNTIQKPKEQNEQGEKCQTPGRLDTNKTQLFKPKPPEKKQSAFKDTSKKFLNNINKANLMFANRSPLSTSPASQETGVDNTVVLK